MMSLIFSGITLAAVFMATFFTNMRHAILSLWVAGLGVGAVYLTLGVELLAVIQWIVSTLVTIAFIFFAVMFGEYGDVQKKDELLHKKSSDSFLLTLLSIVLGGSFAVLIFRGSKELPNSIFTGLLAVKAQGDLGTIGRLLTQDNLLSLEVLALTLFLVLVGGGVVARFEGEDKS